jgi:hypothetical protein
MAQDFAINCKLIGPEADIERFKLACLYPGARPSPLPINWEDENNGIDFDRVIQERGWNAYVVNASRYWVNEHGEHEFYIGTRRYSLIGVLQQIVEMFPTLAFVDCREDDGSAF